MQARSRDRRSNFGKPRRLELLESERVTQPQWTGLWVVAALFALFAAGCNSNSDKDQPAAAEGAQPAAAQPDPAPAGDQGAGKKAGGRRKAFKLGIAQPDAAKQADAEKKPEAANPKDLSKWAFADLKAALTRKDVRFVPAVVLFGLTKPGDSNRATDLAALLRDVAKMKDDPKVDLLLPAAGPISPSQPGTANRPAAQMIPNVAVPGNPLPLNRGRFRFRKRD